MYWANSSGKFILLALLAVCVESEQEESEEFACGTSLRGDRGEERLRAPWTALLFLSSNSSGGVHMAWIGGVIVGPSTVLTRGSQFWESRHEMHCLSPQSVLVGVGISNRRSFDPDEFTQILEVSYIRPHPRSSLEHSDYDFAVVQLKSRIAFSTKVRPICVQSPNEGNDVSDSVDFKAFARTWTRLSGFRYWANYSLYTVDYKLKRGDLCEANCLASESTPASPPEQLMDGGPPCPLEENSKEPNFDNSFLVGSVFSSWQHRAWHLTGLVSKSYGCTKRYSHFISLVATVKPSLVWIHSNIRNGGREYTCMDGQRIPIALLCDGQANCSSDGGSDENPEFCQAWDTGLGSEKNERRELCTRSASRRGQWKVQLGPDTFLEGKFERFSNARGYSNRQVTEAPTATPPPTSAPKSEPASLPSKSVEDSVLTIQFPSSGLVEAEPVTTLPSAPDLQLPASCASFSEWFGQSYGHSHTEGIHVECRSPSGGSSSDCNGRQAPDVTMRLSCRPQYKSLTGVAFTEWNCGADGEWSPTRRSNALRALSCIPECGIPKPTLNPQIVNGTEISTSNWPWGAGLFRSENESVDFVYICGATLIGANALLTAAHCVSTAKGVAVDARKFRIALNPTSTDYEKNSQVVEVESVHVQELYNAVTFEADIAIVKTKGRVRMTESLYPACYPVPGRESDQIERYQTSPGGLGVVVGFETNDQFHLSDNVRSVTLPVVSLRDCYKVLDTFPSWSQICAGHTTGVGVCNGDSGSGLLFQEECIRKLFYVQGIVSHGQVVNGHRCDYNRYSIFTRVAAFKEWIQEILSIE